MTVAFSWLDSPGGMDPALRRQLLNCWTEVSNAGGAGRRNSLTPPPLPRPNSRCQDRMAVTSRYSQSMAMPPACALYLRTRASSSSSSAPTRS